jgi:O-methyltransferase
MNYIFRNLQKVFSILGFVLTRYTVGAERNKLFNLFLKFDYVRLSTFELIAWEINKNKIEGNVAELGVYKGEFAKYINEAFPEKKMYLFDTFKGFNSADIKNENKKYKSKFNDFSNTSIQTVLDKMKFPNNCIVKQGYFPDSLDNLEERFCFVSLDADLFDPIYSGLKYFYPRLSQGGYIFIHDYNNDNYPGAKDAVLTFCRENNVPFVPICDGWGSVIISK